MAEGISTRVQKEVASNEQLRWELENRLENASLESRKMYEQIMLRFDALKGEGSGSTGASDLKLKDGGGALEVNRGVTQSKTEILDLTGLARPFTKYSKLECPRFDGVDFRGWLLKIEQFFEADQTKPVDRVRSMMMHLDGKALQWYQRFMRNHDSLTEVSFLH